MPTLCLGHSKQQVTDLEVSAARAQWVAERCKRRTEIMELEPGEKVKEISFTEDVLNPLNSVDLGIHEQKTNDKVSTAMETMGEDVDSLDLRQTMVDQETQTVIEGIESQGSATQTEEFDYPFKETVTQPFTESYFVNNEDRVRFYTGFDVLKVAFGFVIPFITRRSKTLTLFQEFIMVLMKLRLNVPLQNLAFRFGVSLSTVSRTFSASSLTVLKFL